MVVDAAEGQQDGGEEGEREARRPAVATRGRARRDAGASSATRHDDGGDHRSDRMWQRPLFLAPQQHLISGCTAELLRNIEYSQLGGPYTRPSADGH